MTVAEVRILSRLLIAEFRRAYCHSYGGTLRLVRDGVSLNPLTATPTEALSYMATTYRRVPSLWFDYFLPRARSRCADGTEAAALLDRLAAMPCPFTTAA